MSTQHTPGPWTAKERHANYRGWVIVRETDAGQRRIDDDKDGTFTQANARLIAAAPRMLRHIAAMNHMGGDERGGYCICPRNDGSAPDEKHATVCADARAILRDVEGAT